MFCVALVEFLGYLALQLRNCFGKLNLWSFRQLRVEALAEVLQTIFLVLVLDPETGNSVDGWMQIDERRLTLTSPTALCMLVSSWTNWASGVSGS